MLFWQANSYGRGALVAVEQQFQLRLTKWSTSCNTTRDSAPTTLLMRCAAIYLSNVPRAIFGGKKQSIFASVDIYYVHRRWEERAAHVTSDYRFIYGTSRTLQKYFFVTLSVVVRRSDPNDSIYNTDKANDVIFSHSETYFWSLGFGTVITTGLKWRAFVQNRDGYSRFRILE